MNILPDSLTYEKENKYFPWGELIVKVIDFVTKEAPHNGKILDLMCGPGFLLGKLKEKRPDLKLRGIDVNEEFIKHAQATYKGIAFELADALLWQPQEKFDLIICTGGIHHIRFEEQQKILEKIANTLNPSGKAILADPFIEDYKNETERRMCVVRLGAEYLIATIRSGASDDIIGAAIDILRNDVYGKEFKTSLTKMRPKIEKYFKIMKSEKIWPKKESQYGDYLMLLSAK